MKRLLRIVSVRPDGILMLSILLFFLDWRLFGVILGNVVLHEFGHIILLRRYGVYIRSITVGFTGVCIQCCMDYLPIMPRILCALSGPLFGLCGAFAASLLGNVLHMDVLLLFAGVGVILSLFNLLPVQPMDGWRVLQMISPKAAVVSSCLCGYMIFLTGLHLMIRGYGTGLACLGIFFLLQKNTL